MSSGEAAKRERKLSRVSRSKGEQTVSTSGACSLEGRHAAFQNSRLKTIHCSWPFEHCCHLSHDHVSYHDPHTSRPMPPSLREREVFRYRAFARLARASRSGSLLHDVID
ncbi:hypothetical protein MRB53_040251 [Persea americana]|nr:hypothetical protein MRB53_040251 [Persea americana]